MHGSSRDSCSSLRKAGDASGRIVGHGVSLGLFQAQVGPSSRPVGDALLAETQQQQSTGDSSVNLRSQAALGVNLSALAASSTNCGPLLEKVLRGEAKLSKNRVDAACFYIEQVKHRFLSTMPNKYTAFLDILTNFRIHGLCIIEIIKRVTKLFRDSPDLILGFKAFLPTGYELHNIDSKILVTDRNDETHVFSLDGELEEQEERLFNTSAEIFQDPSASDKTSPSTFGEMLIKQIRQIENLYSADFSDVDAVNFMNQIKTKFVHRPQVYLQFINIVQKHQESHKDGKALLDPQVSKNLQDKFFASLYELFENEPDLLRELSRWACSLSDSSGNQYKTKIPSKDNERSAGVVSPQLVCVPVHSSTSSTKSSLTSQKRSHSPHTGGTLKRIKLDSNTAANEETSETNFADMMKYACADDFLFFSKICRIFRNSESLENFFRVLGLYNRSIISKSELVDLAEPFLRKRPDLLKSFLEMLEYSAKKEKEETEAEKERNYEVTECTPAYKIDFTTCKRLGISYRSLPDSYVQPKCTGRTPLCYEVLNDEWVSFPSWSSEDTSCVQSKKSIYEEAMYRIEDERYELDNIIELAKSAITHLNYALSKVNRKEKGKVFRLDESFGANSRVLMRRTLKLIYGEAVDKMIEGMLKNPSTIIPRVIERLQSKEKNWRNVQQKCNKAWQEQVKKNYMKSLDHQGLTFKQNDLKQLRSKMIVHQFETLYDERQARMEENDVEESGPHCIYRYPSDLTVIYDVHDLIIHFVKRQTNMQKEEKRNAKRFLKKILPCFFNIACQDLSDDEDVEELSDSDKMDVESIECLKEAEQDKSEDTISEKMDIIPEQLPTSTKPGPSSEETTETKEKEKNAEPLLEPSEESSYTLFYGANAWCVIIRLHHALCDRLARLKKKCSQLIEDHRIDEEAKTARLKNKNEENDNAKHSHKERQRYPMDLHDEKCLNFLIDPAPPPNNFYEILISEIKNLLDGVTENNTFEDTIRNMFGTDAYITFTFDKLITTLGRQVQAMSSEEINMSTLELYNKYRFESKLNLQNTNQRSHDLNYEKAAQQLLVNQNCFKTYFIHRGNYVTMELIDSDVNEEDVQRAEGEERKWNQYVQHYLESFNGDEKFTTILNSKEESKMFLKRFMEKPVMLMRLLKSGIERRKDEGSSNSFDIAYTNDFHMYFSLNDNYRMRFAKDSVEVLMKKGAPRRGISKHKTLVARRKERFTAWLEEKLCDESDVIAPRNWLSGGSKIVSVKHPVFSYLTYNRYFTNGDDISANRS